MTLMFQDLMVDRSVIVGLGRSDELFSRKNSSVLPPIYTYKSQFWNWEFQHQTWTTFSCIKSKLMFKKYVVATTVSGILRSSNRGTQDVYSVLYYKQGLQKRVVIFMNNWNEWQRLKFMYCRKKFHFWDEKRYFIRRNVTNTTKQIVLLNASEHL